MSKILIKYAELSTKGANRKFFISTLVKNIKNMTKDLNITLNASHQHIVVNYEEKDEEKLLVKLSNTFGITKIIKVKEIPVCYDELMKIALNIIADLDIKTFKVETKRTYKEFFKDSMTVSKEIGGHILKNTDLVVDVRNPDFILQIEIRKNAIFIHQKTIKGLGGYPVGVAGSVILLLSGGIDSPVAGYLAMKRGIKIIPLYFDSPPHTSEQALNKVKTLTKILSKYDPNLTLYVAPFTKIQEAIYQNANNDYLITLLRRMMYRVADIYAKEQGHLSIINGDSVGQVASQTLPSMNVIGSVTNLSIIRPLACFDKTEIIKLAKKIETYETSILPFEDCCTIFVPKHPVINPKLELSKKYETLFNYETLVIDCAKNIFKPIANKSLF